MYEIPPQSIDFANVSKCRYCKELIGWLESKKTGKKYAVNVDPDTENPLDGTYTVIRNDFHNCRS